MRQVLIDLDLASDPDTADLDDPTSWPAYAANTEPDEPDNVITVFGTAGRFFGRSGIDRQRIEYYGIQIRVRGTDEPVSFAKANEIAVTLDESLARLHLFIDNNEYCADTFIRTSGPLHIGDERTVSKRQIHVINGLVNLCQT